MKDNLLSLDQIGYLFDQIASKLEEQCAPSENLDNCLLSLIDIQKSYEGKDYIEQLQDISVLLNEFDTFSNVYIASYLCGVEGINHVFTDRELLSLVQSVIRPQALESEKCQVNYIRNGCLACQYHYRHANYEKMRNIRNKNNLTDYRLELEFNLVYYKYQYIVVCCFVETILTDKKLCGITSHITPSRIIEILDQSILNHLALELGLIFSPVRFTPKGEIEYMSESEIEERLEIERKKTWKDLWGSRYEELRRQSV